MNGSARLPLGFPAVVASIALLATANVARGYECPESPPPAPTADYQGLHGAVFELDGGSMPYRFFIPEDYDPAKRYPLVLYLHHAGLSGTHQDNDSGLDNCVQLTSEAGSGGYGGVFLHESQTLSGERFNVQQKYPHILVAPQADQPNFGFGGGNAGSINQPEHATRRLVYGILDEVRAAYSVDARRIYVTGISMGCYGAWDLIMRNPGYFAAASPQSCRGDPNREFLEPLVDMPIWSMCGSNDAYVDGARAMAAVFEELGSSQFQYLEMPGVGHSINNRGYDLPGFIDWIFSQSLPGEEPETEDGEDAVAGESTEGGSSNAPPPELSGTTIDDPSTDRPGVVAPIEPASNSPGSLESADDSSDGPLMQADGEMKVPMLDGVSPASSRAGAGGCALAHRAPFTPGTGLLLAGFGLALFRLRRCAKVPRKVCMFYRSRSSWLALALGLGACQSVVFTPDGPAPPPPFEGAVEPPGNVSSPGMPAAPGGPDTSEGPGLEELASDGAPGRTVLRRLNQTEYDNTVRDLLGTSLRPSAAFPPDQSAEGFDTVGSALTTSLSHLEAYEGAAEELVGELFARSDADPSRQRVFSCDVSVGGCIREVLSGFADRAFRRPVTGAEVDRLVQLADEVTALSDGDVEAGLRTALVAVLVSPQFLYRIERPEDPASSALQPLKDHELATRLSYLLWSSMPDDELRAAADAGELTRDPAGIGEAAARMLVDPKAEAFFVNFVGQWLLTRSLDSVDFNRTVYPDFDASMRESAAEETYRFARHLVEQDRPLSEFFTADYTFVDQRLAQHYGLDVDAPAEEFVQASLAGTQRVGILGQTSFLMRVSAPDRTSPVKRGAMVLDALLCAPLPPPPPDVVAALDNPAPESGTTLRDILEQHRADPRCGGCHNLMDPIGLGLENFDAIGSYRTEENGAPIDASGTFLDGTSFSGAIELASILARDERFAPCLTRKLLTYAVGRPFSLDDRAANAYVKGLSAQISAEGAPSFGDWLKGVVSSDAFTMQRGSEQ